MLLCERRYYGGSHQCTTRQGKEQRYYLAFYAALVYAFASVFTRLSLLITFYSSVHLSCIQRKTAITTRDARSNKKTKDGTATTATTTKRRTSSESSIAPTVNPVLVGILHRTTGSMGAAPVLSNRGALPTAVLSTSISLKPMPIVLPNASAAVLDAQGQGHKAVARAAVGKGIRHSFAAAAAAAPQQGSTAASEGGGCAALNAIITSSFTFPEHTSSSLSQLEDNYRNSLNDLTAAEAIAAGTDPTPLDQMQMQQSSPTSAPSDSMNFTCFLSRNSSLIDLAMLPSIEDGLPPSIDHSKGGGGDGGDMDGYGFVDFPHLPHPGSMNAGQTDEGGGETNEKVELSKSW
jgi:hypothetical protein